jgi:hypothetical protein
MESCVLFSEVAFAAGARGFTRSRNAELAFMRLAPVAPAEMAVLWVVSFGHILCKP